MARESTVEKTVCNLAEKAGWFVRKLGWVGRDGAPDRMFLKAGRVVFMEFKRDDAPVPDYQDREHERIKDHGGECYVIRTVGAGLAILGITL